ncbi:hypothetical protein KPC_3280 [Acinetobacter stercoris]|uniref:Uncharacterized protein n=2 Tax=Acinetobacter stercoris TaxID=2126983 RepID=A0A2U3N365_9GAMM|nr:hypothetical protein KPC_3280 [Acinetobacter stercoris]
MEKFINHALITHDRMSTDENYRKEVASRATISNSSNNVELYSIYDLEQLNPLSHAEKLLDLKTIQYIRSCDELDIHAYFILDRWATYQPNALKNLEEQGDIFLLNYLYQQQQKELEILKNPQYAKKEKHLTIHERLELHEISTHLTLRS